MKKVKKTIEKYYKMPHIYREDLEEIIKILEEADLKKYNISTEEYEYDNIEEVPKDLKTTNELNISAGLFDFLLLLGKSYASLRIEEGDNTIKSSGLFKRVDEVISKRERKILWFFSNLGVFGFSVLIAIYLVLIILFKFSIISKSNFLTIIIVTLIFSIICIPISYRVIAYKYSKIQFSKIGDKKNFFIKNKELILKIVIPIISAAAGAIIYKLIDKYL